MRRHRLPLRLLSLEDRCTPAAVSWDGGQGDGLWSSPNNWSNDQLPQPADDVTISYSFPNLSSAVTVNSLKVTGGYLTVNNGSLTVTNSLVTEAYHYFYVNSSGGNPAEVSVGGAVTAGTGGFRFDGSKAKLTLPGLTSLNNVTTDFQATNGASISLPNLTSVTGSSTYVDFRAFTGSAVSLPQVTSLENLGSVKIEADGVGTTVNASGLAKYEHTVGSGTSYLTARNGGVVSLSSGLKSLQSIDVESTVTGLPLTQFTTLKNCRLTVLGPGSLNLTNLSSISDITVEAKDAAQLKLPAISSVLVSANKATTFRAVGSGSSIDLSTLTSATLDPYSQLAFDASGGGGIDISGLTKLENGHAQLHADGIGSSINASKLATYTSGFAYINTLYATHGASISVSAGLTQLNRVHLKVSGPTSFPIGQLTSFNNADLTANSGLTSTFTNLTNVDGASLYAAEGATANFPGVTSVNVGDYTSFFYGAIDAGSTLNLSQLTTLPNSSVAFPRFRASYDGTVNVPLLTTIDKSAAELYAVQNGAVSMPALTKFAPTGSLYQSTITAIDGGVVSVGAGLTKLDRVDMELDAPGAFPVSQLTSMTHGRLIASGGTITLPNLTGFQGSSAVAWYDATMTLSGLTSIPTNDVNSGVSFEARYSSGGNATLNLPNLTSVGSSLDYVTTFIGGEAGNLNVPLLTTLNQGRVDITAYGNSTVNLGSLATFQTPANPSLFTSNISASGGIIQVSPNLKQLDRVNLTMDTGGVFPTGQLTTLSRGSVYVYYVSPNFTNLNSIKSTSLNAYNGASIDLPAVTTIPATERTIYFYASGANSKVSLPALTTLTAATDPSILYAYFGGTVSMPLLAKLDTGHVQLYSQYANSVLDLPSLTQVTGTAVHFAPIEVIAGGTFKAAASFKLANGSINVEPGSTLDFANLTLGSNATLFGTGTLKANVNNGGHVRIGQLYYSAPGTLTIDGNYTQTADGTLSIRLNGTSQGSSYDYLNVTGSASLNGAFDFDRYWFTYQPSVGDALQPVTAASRTGQFSNYLNFNIGNASELLPSYTGTAFNVNAVAVSGPLLYSMSPSGTVGATIDYVEVTFSKAINTSTFDASDVSISGPGGPYNVTTVDHLFGNKYRINFNQLAGLGTYTFTIGPNIEDTNNAKMNQDSDGTNGENPDDRFTGTVVVAGPDIYVSGMSGTSAQMNFGKTFDLGWSVVNQGVGTANGVWYDRVYLSTDAVLDVGDNALTFDISPGVPMAQNDSYFGTTPVTLPLGSYPDGVYYLLIQADGFANLTEGNEANNVIASGPITMRTPPRVTSVQANGGNQRSMINQWKVTFSEAVTLPGNPALAFTLTRTTGPGSPAAVTLAGTKSVGGGGETIVTLTFSGPEFVGGSLVDGKYELKVLASQVTDATGLNLDGNVDGDAGDDALIQLKRKFGDVNGDGFTDNVDFILYRQANGSDTNSVNWNPYFDVNNDGHIDNFDFLAFRQRIGTP